MEQCKCRLLAAIAIAAFAAAFFAPAGVLEAGKASTNEKEVFERVRLAVNIFGEFAGDLDVIGTEGLGWSDPYFNGEQYVIDTEILDMNLVGTSPLGRVNVGISDTLPSVGLVSMDEPGPDFPAESFFDVYIEIEFPETHPGEIFHNKDPIPISGIIDAMPPYFDPYDSMAMPPVILYNQLGDPVGELGSWHNKATPYTPPRAHISVETSKGSPIAVPDENIVKFSAGVSGYLIPLDPIVPFPIEPHSATFGIREQGSGMPFTDFDLDLEGGDQYATVVPMSDVDGWSGYLDVSYYPPEGGYYDIEVSYSIPGYGNLRDTVTTYIDPTPPIPSFFGIFRDSIVYFEEAHDHDIVFSTPDEDANAGEVRVCPIKIDFKRTLTAVDQHGLGLGDTCDAACLAAAAASCLKYWADNGYDELEHEDGDTGNPEESGEDMGEELAGDMGTDTTGTSTQQGVDGIKKYLDRHGCKGWEVEEGTVGDAADLAGMFEEFEADSEDVIILLTDTTAVGADSTATSGHAVTMGSKGSQTNPDSTTSYKVDFMDPWDGSGTASNEYPVGDDGSGQPTTSGYDLDGAGDAKISGYIKVSPPEGGGSAAMSMVSLGGGAKGRPARAPAINYGEWIVVSSGGVKGNGELDTLTWDTTGYPGGPYLLEVRTMDAAGNVGRDIRLAGIPESMMDTGGIETPRPKTGLKGSYPNPFNPATTIRFTLAEKAAVSISIYDLSGRLVRRLVTNQTREAGGEHRIGWDGLNDHGRRLASGVYFCMLKTADSRHSIKLILLR